LNIIGPTVERITFIGEGNVSRSAVVRLSGQNTIVPLNSLGDGLNRIFTIVLSLVNADNGYLLIYEFENGLHYSVQTKIWELIFMLAEKLNIQVFATTHSSDCIRGFQKSLFQTRNKATGQLIRFDNREGIISPVIYDMDELRSAVSLDIETR
jgi:AAA15 family ATPase/GTPase